MALLKVSDNYSAYIVGNFSSSAETITVDVAPVKTSGYLTVFDLNGNQLEKIKYTGVSGLNLTGCIRGLSFDDNSDTPVVGLAQDLKNGMAIKMTVTQHYINPIIDVINGTNPFEDIPKNPSSRIISDNRHLTDKEYVDGISSGGILSMLVSIDSGLNININPGIYILNGVIKSYAGASSEPLTDDDTNYIQLVDGVLDINVDGFDDNAIPLAEVVCASGEIVTLTDKRPFYTGFDLKDNSGLLIDSEGIEVKLTTDGGLEKDVDGISVKLAVDGGLEKDVDGFKIENPLPEDLQLSLISTQSLFALLNDYIFISAGSATTITASDALKTTNSLTYVLMKEIEYKDCPGTIDVYYEVRSSNSSNTITFSVRKNEVEIYTSGTSSTTFQNRTESAVAVSPGDKFQIYARASNASYLSEIKNFRIKYSKTVRVNDINVKLVE